MYVRGGIRSKLFSEFGEWEIWLLGRFLVLNAGNLVFENAFT